MAEAVSLINDARITERGQVTIPQNIRKVLGVSTGDSITFVVEEGDVRIMNSALYAMCRFQKQMEGEAAKKGFLSEEDVDEWITQSRREEYAE